LQLHSLTLAAVDGSQQTSCDHFTPRNKAQWPSNRMLHGPERLFVQFVEEENLLPLPAFKPQATTMNYRGSLKKLSTFATGWTWTMRIKWDNDGTILNTYFIRYYMIMSQWYNTALYQKSICN
jgi:hypothetical protein